MERFSEKTRIWEMFQRKNENLGNVLKCFEMFGFLNIFGKMFGNV